MPPICVGRIDYFSFTKRNFGAQQMKASLGRLLATAAITLLMITAPHRASAEDLNSPVGLWKTIDDNTGKPRGLVRIFEQDGKLFGRLEKSFKPGSENERCEKCTDARKNQPIFGLLIIRDMVRAEDDYRGGDILDPENGSVYRCKLKLDDGGKKLRVRGFIGFSLIGRTQVWERENP